MVNIEKGDGMFPNFLLNKIAVAYNYSTLLENSSTFYRLSELDYSVMAIIIITLLTCQKE